ncbi:MAG: DUF2752 domain-containing protein, partial [Clostridia bacterium]|nr:DUF2752 domain-containing protein [Clostridia bacterium]
MKKRLLYPLIAAAVALAAWLGCPLYELTGITCPLCGTTRAFIALLRGQVWLAFRCQPLFPLVPVGVAGVVLLYGPLKGKRWLTGVVIGIAAALFLMNCLRWAGIVPPPPL